MKTRDAEEVSYNILSNIVIHQRNSNPNELNWTPTRRSDFGGVVVVGAGTAGVLLSLDMIACCPLFVIVTISLCKVH